MKQQCLAGAALRRLDTAERKRAYAEYPTANLLAEFLGVRSARIRRHMRGGCACPDAAAHGAEREVVMAERGHTAEQGVTKPRATQPKTSPMRVELNPQDGTGSLEASGVGAPDGIATDALRKAGYDPGDWDITPTRVSAWEQQSDGDTVVLHSVRANITRRSTADGASIPDFVQAEAKRQAGIKRPKLKVGSSEWFVLALGDQQLGKRDGDGVEGTARRIIELTRRALDEYLYMRDRYGVHRVALLLLGDCIEGHVSQGGRNTPKTWGSITEQVTLLQALLLQQVGMFAPVADEIIVAGVPGNHDEANRAQNWGSGDSHVNQALGAMEKAMAATGAWPHVRWVAPGASEIGLVLELDGTRVGMTHGHIFSKAGNWWPWYQGQAAGRQPMGDLDILLAGHHHHHVVDRRASVEFIQTPALESESVWWRLKSGEGGRPGLLTMLIGGGRRRYLEIHEP